MPSTAGLHAGAGTIWSQQFVLTSRYMMSSNPTRHPPPRVGASCPLPCADPARLALSSCGEEGNMRRPGLNLPPQPADPARTSSANPRTRLEPRERADSPRAQAPMGERDAIKQPAPPDRTRAGPSVVGSAPTWLADQVVAWAVERANTGTSPRNVSCVSASVEKMKTPRMPRVSNTL